MKPEPSSGEDEKDGIVTGDVIGDTAYSERFVLRLLLKFANLDTLSEELKEKTFEGDLCTLWDMTAERDVVVFLQKHDTLKLINFSWPIIESPRIIEILIGIIGNMCCQKEVTEKLLEMKTFVKSLLLYIQSDDSLIIIQLLRLINSSLFLAQDNFVSTWIELFISSGYSNNLYYILKNSSNKELLVTGLENFNTICSYCNTERHRTQFFGHFVNSVAMESLSTAFIEVVVNQKDSCERDELERILLISLQILLNLVGFEKSCEMYNENKDDVTKMISIVLSYYEEKLNNKEIDLDLVDIIESTTTIVRALEIAEVCSHKQYFRPSYSMWKTLSEIAIFDKNGGASFENEDKEELQVFSKKFKACLSTLIFTYMEKATIENLLKVLDEIGDDYDEFLSLVRDVDLAKAVSERSSGYRTRLKETENC
ncbi:hypothetical protein KGM_211839 [Danaus plexippus plexippus]|uniref:Uncharacterized protein n=1 Tax=Danaus plexippus plexippus TaxID=278856 RepID=A0A212F1L8_DANPL|nr:hypothetical protein KGM_211839 [Danaus plexippus plexippus]